MSDDSKKRMSDRETALPEDVSGFDRRNALKVLRGGPHRSDQFQSKLR